MNPNLPKLRVCNSASFLQSQFQGLYRTKWGESVEACWPESTRTLPEPAVPAGVWWWSDTGAAFPALRPKPMKGLQQKHDRWTERSRWSLGILPPSSIRRIAKEKHMWWHHPPFDSKKCIIENIDLFFYICKIINISFSNAIRSMFQVMPFAACSKQCHLLRTAKTCSYKRTKLICR
jgi:hypothetical protein